MFSSSCITTAGSSFSRLCSGKLLSPIKKSDHLKHSWERHDHTNLREPPALCAASSWDWIFHPSIPDSLFASPECTGTFLFCSKAAFWQSKNIQHHISISPNNSISWFTMSWFPSWQGLEFCNLLLTINSNDDKSSSYKANFVIWFCKAMALLTHLPASWTGLLIVPSAHLSAGFSALRKDVSVWINSLKMHPNFKRTRMRTALGGTIPDMLYFLLAQKNLNRETPWTGRTKCCFLF